jgi:hypothetical protein
MCHFSMSRRVPFCRKKYIIPFFDGISGFSCQLRGSAGQMSGIVRQCRAKSGMPDVLPGNVRQSRQFRTLPEYARLRRVATFAYANSASQSEAMREREGRRRSKQDHLVSTLATLAYEVNIVRDRYVRLTLFCSF